MLRKQPIKAERILWWKLRNKQLGYKFKRQFGIGKYIVDFYCPKLKLVIEVDGATHGTNQKITYDNTRQKYLESLGITVKRYLNIDIFEHLDDVMESIIEICEKLDDNKYKDYQH